MSTNRKLFGVTLNSGKLFSVSIYGVLLELISWYEKVFSNVTLSATIYMKMYLNQMVSSVTELTFAISSIEKISNTVYSTIDILSTIRSSSKLSYLHIIPIYVYAITCKAIYKFTGSLNMDTTLSATSMTLALLAKLQTYDPEALGTLDVLTLGEMDSVIIT